MKIRSGFVSNSSSSSFIAVGFGKYTMYPKVNPKFDEAVKAMTGKFPDELDYDDLEAIWCGNGICSKDGIYLYTSDCEPFFVGMDIEEGIIADKRLSEMTRECKKLLKDKLGVSVILKDLEFKNGECSSG